MGRKRQTILEQAEGIGRDLFGYPSLKPEQAAAIESVMTGHDTWVNLRTGAGKSAIYQIPACMTDGLVLVFSPLIALMKDQVDKLKKWGVRAARLSSDMPEWEVREQIKRLNKLDILYIAPERLKSGDFLRRIRDVEVSIAVVDEAHVLSHAMRDFRPAYTLIGKLLKRYLSDVPRLALTATADDYVERDVARVLGMEEYNRITASPVRPNLRYEVVRDAGLIDLEKWLRDNDFDDEGCGIIYAATRARVEEIARDMTGKGIHVEPYHAGLPNDQRSEVQDRWVKGETRIISATNAFGMGVDKPDVRFVYHADPPGSIHEYAQESGRAGRDGEESVCVLNLTEKGLRSRQFFIKTANPTIDIFNAVWAKLRENPVKQGFRLSTYDVEQWLKDYGINPYDAPHYVPNVLGYLEYIGAVTTKPDRVIHRVVIRDMGRFLGYLQKYEDNIQVKENIATITIYPGDIDFVGGMLAKGIATRERAPNEVVRCMREVEEHGIRGFDLDEKLRAAQTRLDLLIRFAGATDKQDFLQQVFGRRLVEQVKVQDAGQPEGQPKPDTPPAQSKDDAWQSRSRTKKNSQQPLLPWAS